jgi:hypothetical protein
MWIYAKIVFIDLVKLLTENGEKLHDDEIRYTNSVCWTGSDEFLWRLTRSGAYARGFPNNRDLVPHAWLLTAMI